jgi:hypothetical protein
MAYASGLAALLVALLAGCTAGGEADSATTDAKPGGPTMTPAPPGKYRTLREPCGSVDRSTLKDLLPGADSLPDDQQQKLYRGTPAVTYDTDRRVGCSWKVDSPDASHQLAIDVERVVSYDPQVSDEDKARQVYATKETAADLAVEPSTGPSTHDGDANTQQPDTPPTASGTTTDPALNAQSGSQSGTSSGTSGAPSDPSSETSKDGGLEPRHLDGLGNEAFLDDALGQSGSAAQHRMVSVVFRTSNVIVTVQYTEQPAHPTVVPDSKELQEKARGLARRLADQLNE